MLLLCLVLAGCGSDSPSEEDGGEEVIPTRIYLREDGTPATGFNTPVIVLPDEPVASPTSSRYPAPTSSRYPAPTSSRYPAPTSSRYPAPTSSRYPAPTSSRYPAPTSSRYPAPRRIPTPPGSNAYP